MRARVVVTSALFLAGCAGASSEPAVPAPCEPWPARIAQLGIPAPTTITSCDASTLRGGTSATIEALRTAVEAHGCSARQPLDTVWADTASHFVATRSGTTEAIAIGVVGSPTGAVIELGITELTEDASIPHASLGDLSAERCHEAWRATQHRADVVTRLLRDPAGRRGPCRELDPALRDAAAASTPMRAGVGVMALGDHDGRTLRELAEHARMPTGGAYVGYWVPIVETMGFTTYVGDVVVGVIDAERETLHAAEAGRDRLLGGR